ncbi:MAG: diaminopimelate decarboxylase [Fidelibacterota bacterium]
MHHHIPLTTIGTALPGILDSFLIQKSRDNTIICYDLDYLKERILYIQSLFPDALHALALKACPLPKVLKIVKSLGVGAEAATFPELYIAEKSGFAPRKIVFDSPAKTTRELSHAIDLGIHLNIDSFSEMNRIIDLLKNRSTRSRFGLRINPQIGQGKIAITSTTGDYSKFGVPMDEFREEIRQAFYQYPWLTGVHLHIGSQGYPVDQLVKGVQKVYNFVEETNRWLAGKFTKNRIKIVDIGGGFPVSYHKDREPPSMELYRDQLRQKCPGLFTGKYRVITEFGRSVFANAGWTASRVEYVKEYCNTNTAVIHVGADFLMRRCYFPQDWHHDFSVLDSHGMIKNCHHLRKYNIVGPLCFSGDILARDIELPEIHPGDFIIIHDTGGYTLSMWSRHLSRQIPVVIGYSDSGKKRQLLKRRETPEDLWHFWQ